MPYTSHHVLLRAVGHFGGSNTQTEQWAVGMKIPVPLPGPSAANLSAFLVDVSPYFTTFHTSTALKAGTVCFLRGLTAAYLDTDGRYVGGGAQTTTDYTYATPGQGNGSGLMPWSTAVVLSLRTAKGRGLASNGRLYWPTLGLPIDTSEGMFAPTTTLAVANAAKTLLDQINSHTEPHFGAARRVAVMSQVGAGATETVTGIRVGGKPDRQERRERSLAEAYSSVTLASTFELLEDRHAVRLNDL